MSYEARDLALASAPANKATAVTPHDTNELPGGPCRALWVGGEGDVKAILAGDSAAVTFSAVPAGSILPVRAKVVHTDTTATLLIAFY